MYRAILPEGELECERYEHEDKGVTLFNTDDDMIAFIPYANLHALLNDETYSSHERSIM